ncbi:hypothetical protein ACFWXR_04045 [[Kitasatospora] papulosa]|uniref:hypothetical protein n=1 Tax=[Kitasatospora] papulosa TaxID=1464011 RepID=UPI00367BA6F8
MKSRILVSRGLSLLHRERCLRGRFLVPIYGSTSWSAETLDAASAYVGLLHAEAESALEYIVRHTLENSITVTKHHATHLVLLNALMHYKRHVNSLIPELKLVPARRELKRNPKLAAEIWDSHARAHYDQLLSSNHGAGVKYVEKLLHPLGVAVDRERFNKLANVANLQEIADVADIGSTDLQELVALRGVAMHANLTAVATRLSVSNPHILGMRGQAAANFTFNLAKKLARSAW